MKRLIAFILTICVLWITTACSGTTYYTITFRQAGKTDVKFRVEAGMDFDVTKTPEIMARDGYTGVWNDADLTNVKKDKIVEVIYSPNSYTMTCKVTSTESVTETIVYNTFFTLPTPPSRGEDYTFRYWMDEETESRVESGTWTYTTDKTFVAVWYYWSENI